ncbi:unnamed protein product, partial [Ilex paraguariensis]
MDDGAIPSSPPSFKHKLKQTLCLSCCFHTHKQLQPSLSSSSSSSSSDKTTTLLRASSTWLRQEFPEIKDKCRNIFSRTGKHRRRHSSTDFRYDPLSYSLNFEDGYDDSHHDEAPLKNFSSGTDLPLSPLPPPLKPVAGTTPMVVPTRLPLLV